MMIKRELQSPFSNNVSMKPILFSLHLYPFLGDSYGISCSSYSEVIGYYPHMKNIVAKNIIADSSYKGFILIHTKRRHRVDVFTWGIQNDDIRCFAQKLTRFIRVYCTVKCEGKGFRMTAQCRDTDTGCTHFDIFVHNFLGLIHHFELFFGVAVIGERIDLWDSVKCDSVSEFFRLHIIELESKKGLHLLHKLFHSRFTRTRSRLVGTDIDALQIIRIVERFKSLNHLDGRAVRVSDDTAIFPLGNVFRVY